MATRRDITTATGVSARLVLRGLVTAIHKDEEFARQWKEWVQQTQLRIDLANAVREWRLTRNRKRLVASIALLDLREASASDEPFEVLAGHFRVNGSFHRVVSAFVPPNTQLTALLLQELPKVEWQRICTEIMGEATPWLETPLFVRSPILLPAELRLELTIEQGTPVDTAQRLVDEHVASVRKQLNTLRRMHRGTQVPKAHRKVHKRWGQWLWDYVGRGLSYNTIADSEYGEASNRASDIRRGVVEALRVLGLDDNEGEEKRDREEPSPRM